MSKERLDVLLVERNLAETREKAKRMIMAGLVYTNQERLDKPGTKVDVEIPLTVKGTLKYVSRGGYKLEKALQVFSVDITDKVVVDIGSSTGGFTDCSLQNGAKLVYAIDVGYNQLAWKLRNDERVKVHERTNFRYVTKDLFTSGQPNMATIDVSFISLRLILPVLKTILANESHIIALIKPQFEAKREQVGKRGVIRDKAVHNEVLQRIIHFAKDEGFQILNLDYSPITGNEGNIEFIAHFGWRVNNKDECNDLDAFIHDTIEKAHVNFKKDKKEYEK